MEKNKRKGWSISDRQILEQELQNLETHMKETKRAIKAIRTLLSIMEKHNDP